MQYLYVKRQANIILMAKLKILFVIILVCILCCENSSGTSPSPYDESSTEELIECLKKEDPFYREFAAKELRERKEPTVIPALIKVLEDPILSIRRTAAVSLYRLGDKSGVPLLLEMFTDDDRDVVTEAMHAFIDDSKGISLPILINVLNSENPLIRKFAAATLGHIKDERTEQPLIAILNDEDAGVRTCALAALKEIKGKSVIPFLIKATQDKDANVRCVAAENLWIGGQEVITWLFKLLGDNDEEVRAEAVQSLGWMKNELAVPELAKMLDDESDWVRSRVVDALKAIGGSDATRALGKALQDKDEHVCMEAIKVLGVIINDGGNLRERMKEAKKKIDIEIAISALKTCLKNKNRDIRAYATTGLRNIGGKAVAVDIIEMLKDKDMNVRANVAEALRELTGMDFGTDILKWKKWLKEKSVKEQNEKQRKDMVFLIVIGSIITVVLIVLFFGIKYYRKRTV